MSEQLNRHASVSEHTAAVLLRTVEAIEANEARAERFRMGVWFEDDFERESDADWTTNDVEQTPRLLEECGTVGCLAAWIIATAEPPLPSRFAVREAAEFIARLAESQMRLLFYTSGWPDKFADDIDDDGELIGDGKWRVELLRQRVEYFIETGE